MPDFRPRFGVEVLGSLLAHLQDPAVCARVNPEQIRAGWAVIAAYTTRHEELGIDVSNLVRTGLPQINPKDVLAMGGAIPSQIVKLVDSDAFFRVLRSRASVRSFDHERIPKPDVLRECVAAAIRSPSVCNRQTWRAHAYKGEMVGNILALQNGNRGFGHTIPLLFVITTDMRQFTDSSERYQPWIEGGIFSMALLLALHAKGLGAVSLNWSVTNNTDRKLKMLAGIPDHERTIVLIGCGYTANDALVAISHRRDVSEILTWHD